MTEYTLLIDKDHLEALHHWRLNDPDGVARLSEEINKLKYIPTPADAVAWGNTGIYRLPVGRYRVTYEVNDTHVTVTVITIGRVPPLRTASP